MSRQNLEEIIQTGIADTDLAQKLAQLLNGQGSIRFYCSMMTIRQWILWWRY